ERRKRELEHIERMRALEVGRSYPGDNEGGFLGLPHRAIPALIAVAIGAGVPLGVFLFALLASLIGGYQQELWLALGLVGLGAVISCTVLAHGAFQMMPSNSASERSESFADSKPLVDEDAYDVVSSRG